MSGLRVEDGRLRLPPCLDLSAVGPLRECLLAARGQPIVIEAGEVTRVTVPALQVLISAAKTWAEARCRLSVIDASTAFLRTIERLAIPPAAIGLVQTTAEATP